MKRLIIGLILVVCLLVVGLGDAVAANVYFTWDPDTEPDAVKILLFGRHRNGTFDYTLPIYEGPVNPPSKIINTGFKFFVGRFEDPDGVQSVDSNVCARRPSAPRIAVENGTCD